MFPFNPVPMIAVALGALIGVAYAVHKALEVMQAWEVLLGVLGAILTIAAITFWSVHHLDNLSRQQPRYVVRDRDGHRLRETNWLFVAWWVWFWRRSDGVRAHDRDGYIQYPAGSWV